MQPVVIESEAMRVGVLPGYGARVVSLIDKASGRDWMFQGGLAQHTGEDAVYGPDAAVGWDECFPTVSPCDGHGTVWGRRLRDHGDLWGRAWTVDAQSGQSLTTTYSAGEFSFSRSLVVIGPTLSANYRVKNKTTSDMPYMWALHGLLAVRPGETISLPGVTELRATYLSRHGEMLSVPAVSWPQTSAALGFPLSEVQPAASGFAGKFYSEGGVGLASVGRGDQWLAIGWGKPIGALGIWANYNGWPTPPHGHHLALEPTTASADHLADALDNNTAAWLAPGAIANWTISITLAGNAL